MTSIPSPSDLSDCAWQRLSPLLPPAKPGGHPRTVNLRTILNGIFSLLRSGCQRRLLPRAASARKSDNLHAGVETKSLV